MSKEQLSMMDLIIETHLDLDRQGPGSPEVTLKALSFIENLNDIAQVLDLGWKRRTDDDPRAKYIWENYRR